MLGYGTLHSLLLTPTAFLISVFENQFLTSDRHVYIMTIYTVLWQLSLYSYYIILYYIILYYITLYYIILYYIILYYIILYYIILYYIILYYIINVINRLHVHFAATVAIPREVLKWRIYYYVYNIIYILIYSYTFVGFLFISNGDPPCTRKVIC